MSFWVYMLECGDGSYYVGQTEDLECRMAQHEAGSGCTFTRRRLDLRMVWSQEFPTRTEAMERERQIKGWSRRKKRALIEGRWEDLSRFARGRNAQDRVR